MGFNRKSVKHWPGRVETILSLLKLQGNKIHMQQRAEIIFELEETVVVQQGGKIVTDFCPRCGSYVEMVSPDILALLSGSVERKIFRSIEDGRIHFIEPDRILACSTCYRDLLAADRQQADRDLPNVTKGK